MTGPPPLPKPTTLDVAAVLRARTKDLDGVELGDFTANTRPTGTEVNRLIDLAYGEVTGAAGRYLGERCAGIATSMIVLRAAMWVESSYWPEQVRSDRSVYREWVDQFTSGMTTLLQCVGGELPDGGGIEPEGTPDYGMIPVRGWTAGPR